MGRSVRECLNEFLLGFGSPTESLTNLVSSNVSIGPAKLHIAPPSNNEQLLVPKTPRVSLEPSSQLGLQDFGLAPPSFPLAPVPTLDELLAGRPPCPICGREDMVRKRDDYPTKHGEIREYWSCDRCGPRVPSNVTGRRRSASLVGDVLGRFYGGASIPNIETGLLENGTKLSPDTILDYAVAFPHLISRFLHWIMQMYGLPNVGNHWQVDEKPVMVQGVQCWILAVIDVTTEFVLVLRFIRSRTIENLENGLREARLLAKKCPLITETDALSGYDKAVRRALGDATHWKVKKSEWYGVNNLIETFNSRLEAFFRVRKGLHEFNTAQHILDGVWIHETVVKKSKSQYLLHQTTAQAAGLGIKLKRPWTDLLSLAEKAALKGHIKFLRPARQKHMDQWLSTPKQTLLRGPKKKQTLLSASHA